MSKYFLILFLILFVIGCQEKIEPNEKITIKPITMDEFSKHNGEDDCWVLYEGKVYGYNDVPKHPNMPKTFLSHCGKTTFEAAAKAKHSTSDENRVANYGTYLGDIDD